MSGSFVHLHLHTEYSIVDSIVPIKALCQEIKKQAMPAVAITDICNMFGMVKFYKNAMQNGIKPIIGSEIWVRSQEGLPHKLVLLCQNKEGYGNLSLLISRAYQEGVHSESGVPLVKKAWIREYQAGLIALSGAQFGEIGQSLLNHSMQQTENIVKEWMQIFSNRFYLEIQRNQRKDEKRYENCLIDLALTLQCPLVATNEVVFLKKEDFDAHKAKVCIQKGTTLEQDVSENGYSEQQYLKSPNEMLELFKDIPGALQNTIEIAKRCSLHLTLDVSVLPSFPVPHQMTEQSYLQKASTEGLQKRLQIIAQKNNYTPLKLNEITNSYLERLNRELEVINVMGFPGYFLIVADFIQWAKSNQIPVGPGRGSGAGSLVAYALAITDLDPIEYELLFERFLNPERVSMPDFDIDFCMDNRDRVIDYVAEKYGRHTVSQIATFGTMAAKAVVRDVGRVLGFPYGFVDRIAKLIPFEIGMTLEKALTQEPVLKQRYEEEEDVKSLISLARKLEGITRNVGKHAGGVVIAPSSLTDFAPLYCENGSNHFVIQFDKDDVEAIGLTKFDFLGLRTLTIIDWAVQNANRLLQAQNLPTIDIEHIALDDPATFTLLKNCMTTAVFQLESRGMKELIKRLQPDHFEEIIALVALFRPGPLQSGMVDDFINRKHGRAKVEYPHPDIEPILRPTYGVILYQEQVMQIAQVLAGYTLGGADLLRRAMGKKKPEEMAQQRTIFVEGSTGRGVDEKTATYIFDLMEKFAGYGFNKSHSAAYALVSYQTAWLKAHFPSPFMAAVLSADMNNTDKIVTLIEECRQCKIRVIPPSVNLSQYNFTVNIKDEIIYGLGAIKGVGEAAILHMIEQRESRLFTDLFDFCTRVDSKKVNKRVVESLIKSGSFDCFGQERATMMNLLSEAFNRAEQINKNDTLGQSDLFQDFSQDTSTHHFAQSIKCWTTQERLLGEKESLGLYFSGHPLEALEEELAKMGVLKYHALKVTKKDQKILTAGLVIAVKTLQTKNGDRMAVITIDDRYDRFDVTVFPEPYQVYRELLVKDQLLILEGTAANDAYSGGLKFIANKIYTLVSGRENFAKKIKIAIDSTLSQEIVNNLKECLMLQEKGECPVYIAYQNEKAAVQIKLDSKWNIKPTSECISKISQILTKCHIDVEYS